MTATASSTPKLTESPGSSWTATRGLVLQVGFAAVKERLGWIVGTLGELLSPQSVLLQGDSASCKREGLDTAVRVLNEEVHEPIVREGSVRYQADL
jgi:hypothetical protein